MNMKHTYIGVLHLMSEKTYWSLMKLYSHFVNDKLLAKPLIFILSAKFAFSFNMIVNFKLIIRMQFRAFSESVSYYG